MVAETLGPDVCIADIARRRGVPPQRVYILGRHAKRGELALPAAAPPMFAEVVTGPEPAALTPMSAADTGAAHAAAACDGALSRKPPSFRRCEPGGVGTACPRPPRCAKAPAAHRAGSQRM